jgi:hypothetical protein
MVKPNLEISYFGSKQKPAEPEPEKVWDSLFQPYFEIPPEFILCAIINDFIRQLDYFYFRAKVTSLTYIKAMCLRCARRECCSVSDP